VGEIVRDTISAVALASVFSLLMPIESKWNLTVPKLESTPARFDGRTDRYHSRTYRVRLPRYLTTKSKQKYEENASSVVVESTSMVNYRLFGYLSTYIQ
jgi:hypothetical protein